MGGETPLSRASNTPAGIPPPTGIRNRRKAPQAPGGRGAAGSRSAWTAFAGMGVVAIVAGAGREAGPLDRRTGRRRAAVSAGGEPAVTSWAAARTQRVV